MVVLKEVNSMFWALFLEAGKRYSQKVERPFHISMAALEIPIDHDALKAKQHSVVSVMVGMDKGEFLLSSLNYKALYQQPLDLNFYEGEEITFFLNGEGNVHLSGYVLEDEPELDSSMFDEEDVGDSDEGEESDDDVPQLVPGKGSKRKKVTDFVPVKKMKWIENGADEADSDEDSDDSEAEDLSDLLEFDEDGEDMEDDDDEEDDDSDDDSDDEDYSPPEVEKKMTKASRKQLAKQSLKQTPKQTPKEDKQQQPDQPKSGKKDKKKNKDAEGVKSAPQTPASNQEGPAGDATESQKKKKKKKKNKNKEKEEDATETPQKQNQATPQQGKQKGQTPKKQVLAGGTVMEEVRPGDGALAKSGKMVHVYYVGKLQKNGSQFDSCTNGKPFRFRLGTNEVIKGWDAGLQGMKVGGKRKLIIPPQQAYGSQKQGGIPPNSTLVFEVELKNVT